jgi:hypothetical protein
MESEIQEEQSTGSVVNVEVWLAVLVAIPGFEPGFWP